MTCIKLAPTTYALTSQLEINRNLAIVAEEGQATLETASQTRHLYLSDGPDVTLFNISLINGNAVRKPCGTLRLCPGLLSMRSLPRLACGLCRAGHGTLKAGRYSSKKDGSTCSSAS